MVPKPWLRPAFCHKKQIIRSHGVACRNVDSPFGDSLCWQALSLILNRFVDNQSNQFLMLNQTAESNGFHRFFYAIQGPTIYIIIIIKYFIIGAPTVLKMSNRILALVVFCFESICYIRKIVKRPYVNCALCIKQCMLVSKYIKKENCLLLLLLLLL